jgi:hypothetical protein
MSGTTGSTIGDLGEATPPYIGLQIYARDPSQAAGAAQDVRIEVTTLLGEAGVPLGTITGTARDAALAITAEGAALTAAQAAAATAAAAQATANGALPKTGGTMLAPITLSGPPTSALHAVTKAYSDASAGTTYTGSIPIVVTGDVISVQTQAPIPATTVPALAAMALLLDDGTTITGLQLQAELGTAIIPATAAATMVGVPSTGIAGTAISGITTTLTPSGSTAYACLFSGGADEGARMPFMGTAVPSLTPSASGSTTVRIYAAATGGTPLQESSAITVTTTGTSVSTPSGGVVGVPVAFTGISNLSTVYVSFIWSGVEGVRVSCTVTSGTFSGSITPLQTYLGPDTIVVHTAASGGTLLYTSPTTFNIAAQSATITAPTGPFFVSTALAVGGSTDLPAVWCSLTLAGVEQTPRIAATVTGGAWAANLTPASTGAYTISTWSASTGGTALATSSITVAATPTATVTTPTGTVTSGSPLTIIGTTNQSAGWVSITEGGVEQTPRKAVTVSSPNWTVSVSPSATGSSTAGFYLASTGGTALVTSSAFTVVAPVPLTLVQHAIASSNNTATATVTLPSAPTVGNHLILMVAQEGGTAAPTITGYTQVGATGGSSGGTEMLTNAFVRTVASGDVAALTVTGLTTFSEVALLEHAGQITQESFGLFSVNATIALPTPGSASTNVLRYGLLAIPGNSTTSIVSGTSGVTVMDPQLGSYNSYALVSIGPTLTGNIVLTETPTQQNRWMEQVNLYGA